MNWIRTFGSVCKVSDEEIGQGFTGTSTQLLASLSLSRTKTFLPMESLESWLESGIDSDSFDERSWELMLQKWGKDM